MAKSYQQRWREQHEALNQYADALEQKVSRLTDELAYIARGYTPAGWTGNFSDGARKIAADALKKEASSTHTRPWGRSL